MPTRVIDADGRIKRSVTSTGPTAWETTTVEVAGWEELDRDTLTGNQANFDFQNISQDYEELWLRYRTRTDTAATSDVMNLALNNDAVDANYRYTLHYWGTAHAAAVADARNIGDTVGANGTAGYFTYGDIRISRYAEAELHVAHGRARVRRTAAGEIYGLDRAVHWETANAINRITLTPGTGPNFVSGSEVVLYGLRKRDVVTEVTGSVSIDALSEDVYGGNLIKNSPGQIVVDGAEPQWWDDGANATLTDEDSVGEGIADKHERCFKLVTTANDAYGYQTLTFADEELLDAGVTVVSFSCDVICATGAKASIGIYGANLGLQESSQAPAGTMTRLKVEGITLNAADTSIQVRLIGDTDTARFLMPHLNVGPKAMPWKARGIKHIPRVFANQVDTTGGDVAWTSTDCTANTDNLAVAVQLSLILYEPNGTLGSYMSVAHATAILGDGAWTVAQRISVVNQYFGCNVDFIRCDDSQNIRYLKEEIDNDNDFQVLIRIVGYWMWE